MGLPKVEISAIPMLDLGIKLNAMNLPLISTFISNSINTAIDEYGKFAFIAGSDRFTSAHAIRYH